MVPLICFHIIEWHHPDRVLRQFGYDQPIPSPPVDLGSLHTLDLTGRTLTYWPDYHREYMDLWENRHHRLAAVTRPARTLNRDDAYMVWYRRHTLMWVGKTRRVLSGQARVVDRYAREGGRGNFDDAAADAMIESVVHQHPYPTDRGSELPPPPPPDAPYFANPPAPEGRPGRRRHGLHSFIEPVNPRPYMDMDFGRNSSYIPPYEGYVPPMATDETGGWTYRTGATGMGSSADQFGAGPSTMFDEGPSQLQPARYSSFDVGQSHFDIGPSSQFEPARYSNFDSLLDVPPSTFAAFHDIMHNLNAPTTPFMAQPMEDPSLYQTPIGQSIPPLYETPISQTIPPFDLNTPPPGEHFQQEVQPPDPTDELGRGHRDRYPTMCGTGSHYQYEHR